jgi:hypothetical protein
MYPAVLGAIIGTVIIMEIQKRNIDRLFEKKEKEMNKLLSDD